jgi:hypothetical protein
VEGAKTLVEYRHFLSWSRSELQRKAELNYETVTIAERGGWIAAKTAAKLLKAINEGLEELDCKKISLADIEGLNIRGVTNSNK